MATLSEQKILPNVYRDSVALMRISAGLCELPGVLQASMIMATGANIELLCEAGLLGESIAAAPNDLLIAVQAQDQQAIDAALAQAEAALAGAEAATSAATAARIAPRSIEMALDQFPAADLALISCPGEYAGAEGRKALHLGLDVMIFSDNVPLAEEVALKRQARDAGRLVMGPDCGTAIIDGVPLGFANVVAPGDIGVIAASGTGLQQVTCLIDKFGRGISQAIGTGGRDLSAAVGGLTMLKGLEILAGDENTKVIALISKPPAAEVATRVMALAEDCGKPVVVNFLGGATDAPGRGNIFQAETLEQAAHISAALSNGDRSSAEALPRHHLGQAEVARLVAGLSKTQKFVRGLYSGGTFSYEALLLLERDIGPVNSPSPLRAEQKINDIWSSTGNTVLDLGDDLFTRGRPHPMIDHRLRHDRILQDARDRETAVILLDVVIGYGSHGDPASEVAASIAAARQSKKQNNAAPIFVVFVCGTRGDPQNLARQEEILREAGATVVESNAQAVRLAGDILSRR
jgi:FdrA protein